MKNLVEIIKNFIWKEIRVEIYLYKHGDVFGFRTHKLFSLLPFTNEFNGFKVKNKRIIFDKPLNKNTNLKIEYNCE